MQRVRSEIMMSSCVIHPPGVVTGQANRIGVRGALSVGECEPLEKGLTEGACKSYSHLLCGMLRLWVQPLRRLHI